MNGRMYDPYIGRFLSVDPIIQFPGNSQSFNGYGYCLNNPLSYSDPSGMLVAPPDLDVGAIDQYFSLMTDINWGMNISVGGGGGSRGESGYHYDKEKKWYFDANGNPVDWVTYNNEIAPHASEIAAILKNDQVSNGSPTIDKGGFVNKNDFYDYMLNHAKNTSVEVGAFELKKNGKTQFFVLPWKNNDRTHTRFTTNLEAYSLDGYRIIQFYHTHPVSLNGLSPVDITWSQENLIPIWVINPNGNSYHYIPYLDRKGGEVYQIDLEYFLNK